LLSDEIKKNDINFLPDVIVDFLVSSLCRLWRCRNCYPVIFQMQLTPLQRAMFWHKLLR